MIAWLLAPLSGTSGHALPEAVAWHGRGMVLAWGVLIPLGVLVARYFKVMPGQDWPRRLDNPTWWRWHLRLQNAGLVVMLAALATIVAASGRAWPDAGLHRALGWTVVALGVLQVVAGLLRGTKGGPTAPGPLGPRGDHYDMTPRRVAFEVLHKFGGLLALLLAALAILAGLVAADAPRWMPLLLVSWWALIGAAAWRLQRRGRCIDTYQAIWGPDDAHPGNRRHPIGLGVRRPLPASGRPAGPPS